MLILAKKINIYFLLIFITIISIYNQNKDIFIGKKEEIKEVNNNSIAIMLQEEDGSYVKSSTNAWPTGNYVFNQNKSKCENGSKLTWNNNGIVLRTKKNERCYVYFDKMSNEPLNIDSVDVDSKSTNNTVILTVNATGGTGKINYSVENTCTKCDEPVENCGLNSTKGGISINNNIITINNLNRCYDHNFTVQVQDESGTIVTSQVSDISLSGNENCDVCTGNPGGILPSVPVKPGKT